MMWAADHPRLDELCWTCMVCGQWRPDAVIAVAHRDYAPLMQMMVNVRYCTDRLRCIAYATKLGPWTGPPPKDWAP